MFNTYFKHLCLNVFVCEVREKPTKSGTCAYVAERKVKVFIS